MITASDIARRIFDKCVSLGVKIEISGNIQDGKVKEPKIVIIPRSVEDGQSWYRGFVDVDYLIPDIAGEKDAIRLDSAERSLDILRYGQGVIEDVQYRYRRYSVSQLRDEGLDCHYVNYKLLIEIHKVI